MARQVVLEVEQHMQLLKRQSRVRVEQWLRKLAEKARLRALTGSTYPGYSSEQPPTRQRSAFRAKPASANKLLCALAVDSH